MRAKRNKRGFTLVEAITASAILSGAVLAVVTISTQSLGDIRLNRHYEVAVALADKQLTMIDYIGVDSFIDSGQTEGDFEEFEPGYHWKVISESLAIDNLYQVRITVSWVERKRPYSISVDTRLNGTGMLVETETE